MTSTHPPTGSGRAVSTPRRRIVVLASVVAVQIVASVFFLGDVLTDIRFLGVNPHTNYEAVVAVALILGTGFGIAEVRRTLQRIKTAERALSVASGAFAEAVQARFAEWGLTPAEAEVALFVLKGFQTAEIAELRGSAEGTVRAQLARVYAKSDSKSRAQFVSQFVEDLLAEPVIGGGQS